MKIRKSDKDLQEKIAEKMSRVSHHGDYFSATCVFHQDSSPSLLCYQDFFVCKTCGEKGPLSKLWKKLSGPQQVSHTINTTKVGVPPWKSWIKQYETYESAAEEAHKTALGMPSLLGYLKKRKISEFTKLGKFGYIGGWISFPVMNEHGEIIDWTLRAHPNKNVITRYVVRPRYSKNEPHHLYVPDWERFNRADKIYVCFGIVDVWALYAAGVASCTGISGKSVDVRLFEDVRKKIIIIPDRGEESEGMSLVRSLGWRGQLAKIDYPDNTKDPSDILTLHGVGVLQETLNPTKYLEDSPWQVGIRNSKEIIK